MSDDISSVAKELRRIRERSDPVSEARREVLPYIRRVKDALGAIDQPLVDTTSEDIRVALLDDDGRKLGVTEIAGIPVAREKQNPLPGRPSLACGSEPHLLRGKEKPQALGMIGGGPDIVLV